jgi:predicted DNA-binding transcriptional regulator AlpA
MIIKIPNELRASRLDEFWDRPQTAQLCRVSERTLDRWHLLRIGPPRIKIGNRILYRTDAVLAWLRSHEISNVQGEVK